MAKAVKLYKISKTNFMTGKVYTSRPLSVEEAVEYHSYTLECGASYQHERGAKKINRKPTTIKSLVSNLNNASANTNGGKECYTFVEFCE